MGSGYLVGTMLVASAWSWVILIVGGLLLAIVVVLFVLALCAAMYDADQQALMAVEERKCRKALERIGGAR